VIFEQAIIISTKNENLVIPKGTISQIDYLESGNRRWMKRRYYPVLQL